MNTKKECIAAINLKYKAGLSNINTSYSNINKSKNVWWFNIATSKFKAPVNPTGGPWWPLEVSLSCPSTPKTLQDS